MAKFKKVKSKKKSSPSAFIKKVAKRAKPNPDDGGGLQLQIVWDLGVGAGAFVGTRLGARIVQGLVARRWPALGRHTGLLTALLIMGGGWFTTSKMRRFQGYQIPFLVGSAIGVLQTAVTNYVPQLAWLFGAAPAALPVRAAATGISAPTGSNAPQLPAGDDDDDFDTNDLGSFKNTWGVG